MGKPYSIETDTGEPALNHLALPKKMWFMIFSIEFRDCWNDGMPWPLTLCFVFDFGAVSRLQFLAMISHSAPPGMPGIQRSTVEQNTSNRDSCVSGSWLGLFALPVCRKPWLKAEVV